MLTNLNEKQLEAVLNIEGQSLILAGAGSGKTKVLTTRIAHLIREKKVEPNRILAITFTNKAAKEMKERIHLLMPEIDIDRMWVGTFHSICGRILRRRIDRIGYNRSFSIYDRDDQKSVIKEIIKDLNTEEDRLGVTIRGIISAISKAKNSRISPEEYKNTANPFGYEKTVSEFYPLYEKKLKQNSALDFDDLILKALELFEKDPESKEIYQNKFHYIFVDEYQDTNRMQYDLVKTLAEVHQNLCVVGDIDQSIYKFRGADINNILDFEKDYPKVKTILLEQNYRSTGNILNTANRVIDYNVERKDKKLWTENDAGDKVKYRRCLTGDEEAQAVVEEIKNYEHMGHSLKEMAILYRTNAQSRSFEEQLNRNGIPYQLIGGLKFYDRKEIKDISAYLKAIVNPRDEVSFYRIINMPKRGIGNTTQEKMRQFANEEGISSLEVLQGDMPFVSKGTQTKLKEFGDLLLTLKQDAETQTLTEFVKTVVEKSGYKKMLEDSKTIEDRTRMENIDEYISSVAGYEEQNPGASLEQYLQEVSLLSDTDKTEEKEGVSLMTIHAAKGTEFDIVFVTGLEQGLFPSRRAEEEGELEEERRLCYVALTRARKKLIVSSADARRVYGNYQNAAPSVFIEEMGDDLEVEQSTPYQESSVRPMYGTPSKTDDTFLERLTKRKEQKPKSDDTNYRTGDRVVHPAWGEGMIVMAQDLEGDQMLTISFPNQGLKKVKKSFAKLRRAE